MNISFVPFTVLWALLAIVVLALVVYRKMVSSKEQETLHLADAAEANHQAVIAHKLEWIDRWGKLLTDGGWTYFGTFRYGDIVGQGQGETDEGDYEGLVFSNGYPGGPPPLCGSSLSARASRSSPTCRWRSCASTCAAITR